MFQKYMSILKKSQLFAGFSDMEIQTFLKKAQNADQMKCVSVPANSYIVDHGEEISALMIVVEGEVSAVCDGCDGSQSLYEIIEEGDLFGVFVNYLHRHRSPITYMSGKKTVVLSVNADYCFEALNKDDLQRFLSNIMRIMAQKQKKSINRMKILSKKSLRTRIMMYLNLEAKKQGYKNGTFKVRMNREQMAKYLCVNRSGLSHELTVLQEEGYISYRGNEFCLYGKSDVERFCCIDEDACNL